jgi:hypothetical protein
MRKYLLWCALIVVAVVILSLSIFGGDHRDDPFMRASGYVGKREAELRQDIGAPTRESSVSGGSSLCGMEPRRKAVRELTYDIPSRGIEKHIREILRLPPALSIVVCVDEAGMIVNEGLERVS